MESKGGRRATRSRVDTSGVLRSKPVATDEEVAYLVMGYLESKFPQTAAEFRRESVSVLSLLERSRPALSLQTILSEYIQLKEEAAARDQVVRSFGNLSHPRSGSLHAAETKEDGIVLHRTLRSLVRLLSDYEYYRVQHGGKLDTDLGLLAPTDQADIEAAEAAAASAAAAAAAAASLRGSAGAGAGSGVGAGAGAGAGSGTRSPPATRGRNNRKSDTPRRQPLGAAARSSHHGAGSAMAGGAGAGSGSGSGSGGLAAAADAGLGAMGAAAAASVTEHWFAPFSSDAHSLGTFCLGSNLGSTSRSR